MKKITCLVGFSCLFVGVLQAADVPFIEIKGHTNSVNSASFSPDGKKIATTSYDSTVRIWDAESGKKLQKLTGGARSAAFSPDGKKIVTASDDNTARIWDADSGKELQKLTGGARSVAFSPDGKKIVTAGYGTTARIWDVQQ